MLQWLKNKLRNPNQLQQRTHLHMPQDLGAFRVEIEILRDFHFLISRTILVVSIQTKAASSIFAQLELKLYKEVAPAWKLMTATLRLQILSLNILRKGHPQSSVRMQMLFLGRK